VLLLGSALLGALMAQLSPAEREALGVPGAGGSDGLPSPTDRLPHPASAAIAGALRQLGWLIESWQGQTGILWQVKVGCRIWPVCWLLRTDAWPADLGSRWAAPTWPIEILGPATDPTGLDHDLTREPRAVPSPSGALGEDAPAPATPHAAGAPLLGEGLGGAASDRKEMTHETPDAR